MSNSAQYAFGVNLSAVAQLLGIDETLLWTGDISGGQTAELSENYSAFKEIKFKYRDWKESEYGSVHSETFDTDATKFDTLCGWYKNYDQIRATFIGSYSATDANHIMLTSAVYNNGNSWNGAGSGYRLLEIIGIGRKQSN